MAKGKSTAKPTPQAESGAPTKETQTAPMPAMVVADKSTGKAESAAPPADQPNAQEQLVQKFNAAYSPGSGIRVKSPSGKVEVWTVAAPASMLVEKAVIWSDNHTGPYPADKVIFE